MDFEMVLWVAVLAVHEPEFESHALMTEPGMAACAYNPRTVREEGTGGLLKL